MIDEILKGEQEDLNPDQLEVSRRLQDLAVEIQGNGSQKKDSPEQIEKAQSEKMGKVIGIMDRVGEPYGVNAQEIREYFHNVDRIGYADISGDKVTAKEARGEMNRFQEKTKAGGTQFGNVISLLAAKERKLHSDDDLESCRRIVEHGDDNSKALAKEIEAI